MTQIVGSITGRGQVTIPVEVRRILGLQPGEKVIFEIDGNQVRLLRPPFTLESAYGSVTPLNRPEDFEAISRRAKEEHAENVVRRMREP